RHTYLYNWGDFGSEFWVSRSFGCCWYHFLLLCQCGLAQILHGDAIIDVSNIRQARSAKSAGGCCIFVASDQMDQVGNFVEAQILESSGFNYIDENEFLSIIDEDHFINKHRFRVLLRIREGATLIRTQGDVIGLSNIAQTIGNF
ncbi:Pyridoxal 5'-phosphate synthase-like subunit PDX1.2, partial [Bienertia sinuspersici]